jgi:hypothetical protein
MEAPIVAHASGGTPIVVWVVYGLGIMAAAVFALAALFVLGAYIGSDEVPFTIGVSTIAIVVWGGLLALALGTWLVRRRGRR